MQILDDSIDFASYMKQTEAHAKVRPANEFVADAKRHLRERRNEKKFFLPWGKSFSTFDFRPGEVTIWGGINGHGKSMVVTHASLALMAQGQKVCTASFELKPRKLIDRKIRMFCGMNPWTPEFQGDDGIQILDELYDQFGAWSDGKLWIYDQQGTTNTDTVLGVAKYAANELGIEHIVIDNLAKCIPKEDDYNGQKYFIDCVTAIARDANCHIHVVHHMRKSGKETDPLDKNDLKGSGSIADQPDNIIGVWRNKAKEMDVRVKGDQSKMLEDPDVLLTVFKQRNYDGSGDNEPQFGLWFDRESWQYKGHPSDELQRFDQWDSISFF